MLHAVGRIELLEGDLGEAIALSVILLLASLLLLQVGLRAVVRRTDR